MSLDKKKALGRGLESLLPKRVAPVAASAGGNGRADAPAAAAALTVEQVKERALEAAASGASPWGVVSDSDTLAVMAAATQLTQENVKKAATLISERWGTDFLKEHRIRPGEMVVEIPVQLIARNPFQTRFTAADDPGLVDLAESIKEHGVLQPVVVCPLPQPGPNYELYHLIAGERRWLASKLAQRTHLPAIVRHLPPHEVMLLTIIENLHRQDLNPMQHARAFYRLVEEFHLTQDEVAQRLGLPRSVVGNYLRLTRLPEIVQKALEEGRLTFGHAKVLLSLGSPEAIELCGKKVAAGRLTVRETEMMVEEFLRPPMAVEKPERKVDPNVRAAEQDLERVLGCRVRIKDRNGKGKIEIEYKSLEDFDRVLEAVRN